MAYRDTRPRSAERAPKRVIPPTATVNVEGLTPGNGLEIVGDEVRLAVEELPTA